MSVLAHKRAASDGPTLPHSSSKQGGKRSSKRLRRPSAPQYQHYFDFLMSLPFESVFGWRKEYRTRLCQKMVRGNRDEIKDYLKSAIVQFVGPVSLTNEGADLGANAQVFTNVRFQTRPVVVKVFNPDISDHKEFNDDVPIRAMYEAVMGVIVHAMLQQFSANVRTPNIYCFGFARLPLQDKGEIVDNNNISKCPVIVMSPLQGQRLALLSEPQLERALYQTATCLNQLQQSLNFSHRDLHTGNLRFDPRTEIIEIFDFGESCFRWTGSTTSAFQFPKTEMYDSTCVQCKMVDTCNNRSFDLSVLVASCLVTCPNISDDGLVFNLALEILSFYQQFNHGIMDFSDFYKQYNIVFEKCIPTRFLGTYFPRNKVKDKKRKPLHPQTPNRMPKLTF